MVELGRISALYGVLENVVNIAISKLAGYSGVYDYRSAIMLAHSNFQQRVDILATLFEQTVGEHPQLKGYEEVIKLIKRAQKGRNKFMHSSLGCDPDSGNVQLSAMSARGSLKTKVETVYIKEIIEVSAVTHEATCALHIIITGNEIKPLWERNA
jgi:hypothetical protein